MYRHPPQRLYAWQSHSPFPGHSESTDFKTDSEGTGASGYFKLLRMHLSPTSIPVAEPPLGPKLQGPGRSPLPVTALPSPGSGKKYQRESYETKNRPAIFHVHV